MSEVENVLVLWGVHVLYSEAPLYISGDSSPWKNLAYTTRQGLILIMLAIHMHIIIFHMSEIKLLLHFEAHHSITASSEAQNLGVNH